MLLVKSLWVLEKYMTACKMAVRLAGLSLFSCVWAISDSVQADDLQIDVINKADIYSNLSGGIKTGTAILENLDIQLTWDVQSLTGRKGTLFLYGMYNNAATFTDRYVGDFQTVSNIDNSEVFRLEEAWYEHPFDSKGSSVKLGLYDLNSEFDAIEPASFFLNSSHGIGPDYSQSGLNGPSIFPSTSLAVRVNFVAASDMEMRFAILDAEPNNPDFPKRHEIKLNKGFLLAGEVNKKFSDRIRVGFGGWAYTKKVDLIDQSDPQYKGSSKGVYGFVSADFGEKGHYWLRHGYADSQTNQLASYIGGGVLFTQPFGQEKAQLGLAVGRAKNGQPFLRENAGTVDKTETTFEVSYRVDLFDWIALQPDFQYIINPGMDRSLSNAIVLGLRVETTLSF